MSSKKPDYKTSRKYKCPFCDFKAIRGELVTHVEKKHEELIPEGYDAARCVYDFVNGKNYGTCMICKDKVYEWNDKIHRYNNLCQNPQCRAKVREIALARHMKVYNKPTLLNDPEQQEKMLANRKISGKYKFSDGGEIGYTGKYEMKALEFMDKVLQIPSKDIQAPGPVLEYNYNGEVHKWIIDIFYIPANLLIEVKDGGSNPNKRSMESYREKQIAKEKMVTDLGTYNYIRLTDNNFSQLLAILADMKDEALHEENPKAKIHINEEVGGMPRNAPPEAYIIPYGMNNAFAGFGYTDSSIKGVYIVDDENNLQLVSESFFKKNYQVSDKILHYENTDAREKIPAVYKKIMEDMKAGNKQSAMKYFCELLLDRKLLSYEEIFLSESFKYYDKKREEKTLKLLENGAMQMYEDSNVVESKGNVFICHSPNGYYACTNKDFYLASDYFSDVESLKSSGVIDLMNDIYQTNKRKEVDDTDDE